MLTPGYDTGRATAAEIDGALSLRAVRRAARVTRPGLEQAWRQPAREVGIALGRQGGPWGRRLYASLEEVVLAVAPPRSGKTAWLGGAVIDAPGACVATSTRTDLHDYTARLRADRGPVAVFNPEGLGGLASSFRWSPLDGCAEPQTAMLRAGYLLSGSGGSGGVADREFWEGTAYKLLRCLLFAAAVSGRTLADVAYWAAQPRDRTALDVLEHCPATPPGWAADVRQLLDESPDKTRDSVFLTLAVALQFMAQPSVAAAVLPAPGEPTFDVADFIAARGTLYLIGAERPYDSVAPLFTAFAGHLFETAKRLAADRPGGRLDPPLMLALDEAALICPLPLERWTSDGGGRGIPLLIAVQSPSQLYERWGREAGRTIWSNSAVKLVFGGLTVAEHLREIADLCGERDERSRSYSRGPDGRKSWSIATRRVPVFGPDELRGLGRMRAVILHRTTRPVLARITPVWQRGDVRRIRREPPKS